MVFGGGAPSVDWQRTSESSERVASVRCFGNRAAFGGRWHLLLLCDYFEMQVATTRLVRVIARLPLVRALVRIGAPPA